MPSTTAAGVYRISRGSLMTPTPSSTHLVLIPSYNPGRKVLATVRAARAQWTPVWVVIDGSTDGSADWLREEAASDPGLRVLVLPENQGKGSAVLEGITRAAQAGFLLEGGDVAKGAAHLAAEATKWQRVIRERGIRFEG